MSNGLTVVLGTNVLISGLSFPASVPGAVVAAWRSGGIEVVSSDYMLDELRRVLPRLNHRHGMSDGEIDDLVDIMSFWVQLVEPVIPDTVSVRDPYDVAVLGTLLAAREHYGADYLVTGDKDLLELKAQFPIVTPAEFWRRHGGL
ncbi:putative toxin-antitoxin system toxin component, PIN family [Natronospirillum operosum]|uniref:Putative toxin-antitoxin system toxin component, PIN family n=1 Tax=Natronospirillum operosum TaxID=2759953 RepID=A0A4Z0WBT7_9GAMM|nr:putative toxin-antitoxin system toxin component, PIN family [Natronospirillum operosum]TGG95274.1 putative toxin-antitoxin system toxin component, PIN family [Natronospirillum operosum]